ncbi:MAG: hypothetical protein DRP01_09720 [Archaeoglobales archaeon]|nr:MAG: hypothetical protein DRP01_09720 [Archaeoglobales archaeon]
MTLKQFLEKYLGQSKGYPTDKQYKGECLSICKLYIKEVFGISPPPSGSGSAYGYWSNFPNPLGTVFKKVNNTPDLIPQEGWIAVWKPWSTNKWGHIAIVAKGSTKGILKNWAQNWSSRIFQLESNRYTNVIGFLVPKSYNNPEEPPMNEITKFLKEKDKYTEGDVREMYGAWMDLENVRKTLDTCQTLTKSLEQNIKELKRENKELSEKCSTLAKDLDSANRKIVKLKELVSKTEAERNQYRKWYEKTLSRDCSKLNFIQLVVILLKKLLGK